MNNLTQLLAYRRSTSPERRFGMVGSEETFGQVYDRSARLAALFAALGVAPGDCVAVIGSNSRSYLTTYCALQLAGAQTALINPTYPAELLEEMLADLQPTAVVWIGPPPVLDGFPTGLHFDAANAEEAVLVLNGTRYVAPDQPGELPGLHRLSGDVAGYMHTSGTTGRPKFCAQTHEYFLRLGRFIADSLGLSETDTVFAPLPLFHINPLGYGVIGALVAGAGVVSTDRFSASRFWADVRSENVTALILHGPPVEILKRATTKQQAAGHHVRIVFFADEGFLTEFEIPLGVSAYGSTEAGGLCHVWLWRRGETAERPGGMSRYGGRSRHDVRWRVSGDGEIQVRAERAGVLFEGYRKRGELIRPFDEDGWFATGDLGEIDAAGNLVFIERRAESIRVKGEFVPIGFVEQHFAGLPGIKDVAVWRRPSQLIDDDVALFVVGDSVDIDAVRSAAFDLPAFMRPSVLLRLDEIPRGAGVGKILRRTLDEITPLESVELW